MSEKINIIIAAQTNAAVKGLDQVSRSTHQVGQSVQNAQAKMARFNKSVSVGRVNLRKFGMGGLQQAGYQIGDFAVQVANGTSKMQAFGQQAPQLLQIFGPIGAVVGAAVAIFAAFAVVAEKTSKASGNAKTAVEDLNQAFDTLKKVDFEALGKSMSKPAQMVLAKYSGVLNMIERVAEEQRSAAIINVIDKFAPQADIDRAISQVKVLQNEFDALPEGVDPTEPMLFEYEEAVANLRDLQGLRNIMNGLDAKSREEAAKKLQIVTDTLTANKLLTPELEKQLADYAQQFGLVTNILNQAKAVDKAENSRLAIAQKLTRFMREEDTIMGQTVVKANGIHAVLKAILQDRDRIKKTLQDEDTVMGQLVAKSFVYAKNMIQGGRGGDPRQFTYMDEFRKQLDDAAAAAAKLNDNAPKGLSKIAAKVNGELSPAMKQLNGIMDSVGQSFENAMMSAVDGTKSTKEAFKSMASEIIKELYRVFVVKQITGFIMSAVGGYFNANQVSGPSMPLGTGNVRPQARTFAGGGYTGSGPRAGGLDGKGGFMAMLHPRETVTDHTRGQGGGQVVVNQTINVSTGVQQTVRTEIKQLMPQIAESAKSAVVDAKRRGGSYGRAFA
jgi:hypothetical protein